MDRYYFTDTEGLNPLEVDASYITGVKGLGLAPVIITQSSRGYGFDGLTVTNAKYDARPFSLAFDIYDPQAKEQMRAVGAYFADNQPKSFWYKHDDEEAKCLTPVFLNAAVDFDLSEIPVKNLVLSFIAPDPWFKVVTPFTSRARDEAVLEFTLEIPAEGVIFSTAAADLTKSNGGDKEADTIIRFIGGVDRPVAANLTTGERLAVNRNIAATDILEINSATGRVDIIDGDGERHNAFNYIGDNDSFIHLAAGVNTLSCRSEGGIGEHAEVSSIEYYATV